MELKLKNVIVRNLQSKRRGNLVF